jgi:hypothetical protein
MKMTEFTEAQIIKAATLVKILQLTSMPGMDAVAVKLNREPTCDEERVARMWAKEFQLAQETLADDFTLAGELYQEIKRS